MTAVTTSWELPPDESAKPKSGADLSPWQFSTKRLLIAICVIGLLLPPIIQTAGWFYYASSRMNWQRLSVQDVALLSQRKRYAIVLRGINHRPLCGNSAECFDNHALRVKVDRLGCETYYLSMPNDAPVLDALQKRFPGLRERPGYLLLIDQGQAVTNTNGRWIYEFAEQLNVFE